MPTCSQALRIDWDQMGHELILNLRNWMVSVHCIQDTLQLHSYLEHQGTKASRVAVHLQADRVVGLSVLAPVDTADSHPLLSVEGCGDNRYTF